MKIKDILKLKEFRDRPVVTVGNDELVSSAIKKLADNDRGALVVCNDKEELIGIVTERDIVRKCFTLGDDFTNKKIADVMTKQVAVAIPEDDLDYAINTMKQKRIRHIPIVDDKKVLGMISMRDILGFQHAETKAEIRYVHLLPRR